MTSDSPRRGLTLLAMSVAQAMIMIDITIVNTALPAIQRGLHMSAGDLEWVISAYALSLAAFIPLGGALGDRYGRKTLFLAGMTVFVAGSVACALAGSDATLIVARAVQGVGGAIQSALTLSILTDAYPPEERPRAIGLWAAIGGMGFGLGPVAGGLLLSHFGWASVFWVNLPIGAAGLVVSAIFVANSKSSVPHRLDLTGVGSSAAGLFAMTLGLIESSSHPWGSWPVAAPLAAGAALLAAFFVWEARAPHPMLPPKLLQARSFSTGCAVYLLAYVTMEGVMFYVTLLYQDVDGWSALRTGLSWLSMNLPFLLMAQFAGRLHARFHSATVVAVGCLVATPGIGLLAALGHDSPFLLAFAGYVLLGLGYGMLVPGIAGVAMRDVPADVSGAASGVLNASRQIGTSVGLAILGAIGVAATNSSWSGVVDRMPAALRQTAGSPALRQHLAGAQIHAVTATVGQDYRTEAISAFLHGYHLAVIVSTAAVLLAALLSFAGLRGAATRTAAATAGVVESLA